MATFDFFTLPKIVFGRGTSARIGELTAPLGRRALIVYNGGESSLARLAPVLSAAGIRWAQYRQKGEPQVADVDAALEMARREKCEVVIGLGGGSAIDCGKAVAALLTNGGAALDYMEVVGKGQKITRDAAPWIAVPTTAGAGAEVTRNAVIAAPQRKFKASIRGEQLVARVALVDPELGLETPPQVTASSGMDALCQCIEAYTSRGAQPMTDALALRGIRAAATSLRRAFQDGADLAAREEMALSALFSGIALANAGLGAVHGFAAPLGANFPIPHGVVCAALLPHVIDANISAARALPAQAPVLSRYADVGRALAGRDAMDDSEAVTLCGDYCRALAQDLGIPKLGEYGMAEAHIASLVESAKKASSMRFNPVALSDAALSDILRHAL